MSDLEFCWAAIKRGNTWKIKIKNISYYGLPVDGEQRFGMLGLSAGIMYFADPNKPQNEYPLCHMGISYFREHAKELVEK